MSSNQHLPRAGAIRPGDDGKIRLAPSVDLPRRHAANIAPPYFMELTSDCLSQYLAGHIDKVNRIVLDSTSIENKATAAMFRVLATAYFESGKSESWHVQLPFQYGDEPLGRETHKGYVELAVQLESGGAWTNVHKYEPPENVVDREVESNRHWTKADPLD